MTVIGSCGHDITDLCGDGGDWGVVITSRLDKRGDRIASYESVCRKCRDAITEAGCLLRDDAEADAWIVGTLKRNVW